MLNVNPVCVCTRQYNPILAALGSQFEYINTGITNQGIGSKIGHIKKYLAIRSTIYAEKADSSSKTVKYFLKV